MKLSPPTTPPPNLRNKTKSIKQPKTRTLPRSLRRAPRPAHPRLHEQGSRGCLLREGGKPPIVRGGGGGAAVERDQLRPRLPAARRRPGLSHGGRGAVDVLVPVRRRGRHLRGVPAERGGVCCLADAGLSGCPTVRPSLMFVCLPVCLSAWLVVRLTVSVCLSACLCVRLFDCLSLVVAAVWM